MVTYTFTNGTVADADEVNQNFTEVETLASTVGAVIGKDLVGDSISLNVSNGGTTGWTLLASASIPANKVKNYVIIKILGHSTTTHDNGSTSGNSTTNFDIRAGETGNVTSLTTISPIGLGFVKEYGTISGNQMLEWYYEPSSSEINNGFDIEIYGKVDVDGDQAGAIGVNQLLIIG